jgi:hypothetical protein
MVLINYHFIYMLVKSHYMCVLLKGIQIELDLSITTGRLELGLVLLMSKL